MLRLILRLRDYDIKLRLPDYNTESKSCNYSILIAFFLGSSFIKYIIVVIIIDSLMKIFLI